MIDDDAIAAVLGQRLVTIDPARPIAWPGMDLPAATARPYLIFDHVPVSRTDDTLKGGVEIVRGFIDVAVISEPNLPIWSTSVKNSAGVIVPSCGAIAKAVRALFPYAVTRLAVNGGEITIVKPPEIMQSYNDGPHWRTPIKVLYEAS